MFFQNIASRAKRCINRHDFAAVLVVFPILKHLLTMRPEFERTVEGCDFNVRSKFASILNTLHGTVSIQTALCYYGHKLGEAHGVHVRDEKCMKSLAQRI
jgi:exocyst complex protein 7